MEDILVPVALFSFLTAIIVLPAWFKERTKQSAHNLIAQALEKGQQLDPQTIERIVNTVPKAKPPKDQARSTLGSAIVMLALAGGFVIAGALTDAGDHFGFGSGLAIPAAILGALGLGFLILAIVDYRSKQKNLDQ